MDFDAYFSTENVPMSPKPDVGHFPEDVQPAVATFARIWKMPVPTRKAKDYKLWVQEAREMVAICGGEKKVEEPLRRLFAGWNRSLHEGNGWSVTGIQSVTGMLRQEVAKMHLGISRGEGDEHSSWNKL